MKKYVKAQVIAKNLPTGSYAAGCPADSTAWGKDVCAIFKARPRYCKQCERAQ